MDAWQSFYHFNKTVLPNLSNYNEDDAWPSMVIEVLTKIHF